MKPRRGSTLLELLVVVTIVAIVAVVALLALPTPKAAPVTAQSLIDAARRTAVDERRPITVELVHEGRVAVLTALPDGGVVADPTVHLDRFTGARLSAHP